MEKLNQNYQYLDSDEEDSESATNQDLRNKYMVPKNKEMQGSIRVGPQYQAVEIPQLIQNPLASTTTSTISQQQSGIIQNIKKPSILTAASQAQVYKSQNYLEEEKLFEKFLKPKQSGQTKIGSQYQATELPVPKPPQEMMQNISDVSIPSKRQREDEIDTENTINQKLLEEENEALKKQRNQ
eukprot:403340577